MELVVTAHKPTFVSPSRINNFTNPHKFILTIAKGTSLEIHIFSPQGLQPLLDVPIYGRFETLEPLRPPGETQEYPSIST